MFVVVASGGPRVWVRITLLSFSLSTLRWWEEARKAVVKDFFIFYFYFLFFFLIAFLCFAEWGGSLDLNILRF